MCDNCFNKKVKKIVCYTVDCKLKKFSPNQDKVNNVSKQMKLKETAILPTKEQFGKNIQTPRIVRKGDKEWSDYLEQYYYDSSERKVLLPPNYEIVAKGFFNETLQDNLNLNLDNISSPNLVKNFGNYIIEEGTRKNSYYLLEPFDVAKKPLNTLAQGQTGACYANAISNWSVISIALAVLNGTGKEWLSGVEKTVNNAYTIGNNYRVSRPSVIYSNGLTLSNISYQGAASLEIYQSGGFFPSLFSYPKLIVPEQTFYMPFIYNSSDYWSEFEGTPINVFTNGSLNAKNGLSSSLNPPNQPLPVSNFIFGNPFYIQKVTVSVTNSQPSVKKPIEFS